MARSPYADNYEPTTRCIVCDAPVRRFDLGEHLAACVKIDVGLAGPVGPEEITKLPRRRRPVEKPVTAP